MASASTRLDHCAVVVWGGGTGGVAAALQSARGGAPTLLLTPGAWLGGMVSAAGVCAPDGNELSPWQTGLWGAFLRELRQREAEGLDHNWVSCFGYRPSTAEAILRDWCAAQANLLWWPHSQVVGIQRQGPRMTAITVQHNDQTSQVGLDVLIDGSDRGDLFAIADVPYRFGWEPQELWGEPSAPPQQQIESNPFFQAQVVQSPTWVVMGQLVSDRMPKLDADVAKPDRSSPGEAPLPKATLNFGLERTITYGRLPGGLVMLNWPLEGNDWHGPLDGLFDPEARVRADLYRSMQAHSLAFAKTLEDASNGWLVPGACFPLYGDPSASSSLEGPSPIALMPYWREGRRLVGREVVVEQHLLPQGPGASIAEVPMDGTGAISSIAIGNYANDHHYPGDDYPLAPKSTRWGGRWSGTPFAIPYGALLSDTAENFLAADKCFSASHMANGATRLQPLILNLGQACGAAAALAVQQGRPPAALPVRQVQNALIGDPLAPAAVVPLWDTPWYHSEWGQRQTAILDNPERLSHQGLDLSVGGFRPAEAPPVEPGETSWTGRVFPDGTGGYTFKSASAISTGTSTETGCWPLITLEPGVNRWLSQCDGPTQVTLIGQLNPWGPWLRANRIAS